MFTRIHRDIRGLHPHVVPVILGLSVYNFGWGFADPYFSLFMSSFTNHFAMLGFLNTLLVILTLVILIPLGRLLDTTNHYAITHAAKIGYAVCGLLYFFAGMYHQLWILVIALLLNGILMPLVWTTASATLRLFSRKSNAALVYGLVLSSRNITWIVGVLCSMVLVRYMPLYYIFLPISACALISMWPTRKLLPTHAMSLFQGVRALSMKKMYSDFIFDARTFPKEMWWTYAVYFMSTIVHIFWFTYIPLYMKSLGISLGQIGLYVIICTIPFIFSFVIAEISDRSERLKIIMLGFVIAAVSTIALGFMPHTYEIFLLLGFCSFFGYAMVIPATSAIITLVGPKKESGAATALLDMTVFVCVIIFSPVIGRSVDVVGWAPTAIIIGAVLFVVAALVLLLKDHWASQNMIFKINHPSSKKQPYIL